MQHDVLHKHIAGRKIKAEQVDAVQSTVDHVSRVQRKLSYRQNKLKLVWMFEKESKREEHSHTAQHSTRNIKSDVVKPLYSIFLPLLACICTSCECGIFLT